MNRYLLPLLLFFAACPDPSAKSDGGQGKGMMGGPPPGGPPPGGQPPGGAQPPGSAPTPTGGVRPNSTFQVAAGQGVKLSGTVTYEGAKKGDLRVDFLRSNMGSFPELVHSLTLPQPGAFEVEAPKGFGEVSVVAFLDADGNGPSDGEPAARIEGTLKIEDQDLPNLVLALTDNPELGDLKPPGQGGGGKPAGDAMTGGITQAPGANTVANPTGGPGAQGSPPPGDQ